MVLSGDKMVTFQSETSSAKKINESSLPVNKILNGVMVDSFKSLFG